ncbi:Phenolic glucoside malonyltransferase [Arachis hypogaea]|nr:Phenolic glucoside malonyltransferase [Arachis hypogaea]
MASSNNNISIKIIDKCRVSPPPAPSTDVTVSLPLTFFDLFWVRFHPVERVFFYKLHSPPSFFIEHVLPKLKTSLSLTLQHFLPLAGNLLWPSHSDKPILQYNPGDGVSLLIAESDEDFHHLLSYNSPREASETRCFVPELETLESRAALMSLQITLFPNSGFSIGISTHHAALDGKSSTMFIKAWASICQSLEEEQEESPTLVREFEPFFDREVIKDPKDVGLLLLNHWSDVMSKMFPDENNIKKSLKILPFEPKVKDSVRATFKLTRSDLEKVKDSVRATFKLTRSDLEKVKKKVLSNWNSNVNNGDDEESTNTPPSTLSTFVLTCSYVLVCIAKAINGIFKERKKFGFAFTGDCRNRLEPPIPENYCGNCLWAYVVDAKPEDFVKENGVVLVAKGIYKTTKMLGIEGFRGVEASAFDKYMNMAKEGVEMIGTAGSNRFGVYGIDFGWGKPEKVEIASIDRGLTMGLAENSDGNEGGVEVGLVLNKQVMDLFRTLFREGLEDD